MKSKKILMKAFAYIFSLLLIIGNITFIQPLSINATSLENAVTITAMNENGDNVLPLTAVSIAEGDTSLDVLQKAGKKNNAKIVTQSENGEEDLSINGVKPSTSQSWLLVASGQQHDNEVTSYKVKNGQHIYFRLNDNDKELPTVTGKVSAKGIDGTAILPETTVTVPKGATAYDVLVQAAKSNSKNVQASIDSDYHTFVNQVGDIELGQYDYWSTAINGTALEKSIVGHQIKNGDHLQLQVKSYTPPEEDIDKSEEEDKKKEENEQVKEKKESTEKPGEKSDENKRESTSKKSQSIQQHISDIKKYISANKITFTKGQEWWVWGAAHTDLSTQSYVTSLKGNLPEKFRNLYDLERMIIAISATDEDATNIEDRNLVVEMMAHSWFETDDPLINALIYGLLAIDSGNYEVPKEFRQQLVDGILAKELPTGGWDFFGGNLSPDMTGMALSALAPYQKQPKVKKAIDTAVHSLASSQDETGGYYIEFNGGDSSESVSQAIIGLTAVGIDPTSKQFTKQGGNLVQHLEKFKQDDGGFSHLIDGDDSNPMATQQALLALVAYQNFTNNIGYGSVYHFKNLEEEEKPKPELPEEDDNEKTDNPSEDNEEKKPGDQPEKITLRPDSQIKQGQMEVDITEALLSEVKENQLVIIQPNNAKEQNSIQVKLNQAALNQLVNMQNDLKINKGDTFLLIPNSIIKQLLNEASGGTVSIQMVKQKADRAIGEVYDYTIFAGDNVISNFNNEHITVGLDVDTETVKDFENDQVKVFYYNEEKEEWEILQNSKYDPVSGMATAQVKHFSTYGVFKEAETQQLGTPEANKENEKKKPNEKGNSNNGNKLPNTATSMFNFIGIGFILLSGGIALILVKRRKSA